LRQRRLELLVWSFLLSLSFYPVWFGFLAWFSLVRPFIIISRLRGREAFNAAYFFSFFFNAFSLYWVAQVTPPGIFTACIIVAFYYTAIFMIFNRVYQFKPLYGFVALPFLWTGLEYFRTLSQFAFPWSDLGYSQAYYLYIIQVVSIFSVHGLTFLIVTVNVLVWLIFRKELSAERRLTSLWAALSIIVALVAYGWIEMPRIPVPGKIDIALLQGSVPIEEKWREGNEGLSFRLYDSLSRSVQEVNPDDSITSDTRVKLFVWPETSAPSYLSHDRNRRLLVGQSAISTGAYHLVGALGSGMVDDRRRYYNSCYLFDPDGQMGARHDKVKLVPFTEQVPYQDNLPFLRKEFLTEYLTFIKTYDVNWWSDFYPGRVGTVFDIGDTRFGTLICFECTFPEFTRQMLLDGADFLVGITNDTWFGHSVGIHMHSRMFITRAVENRCWMARCANSGLTYIVDGYGRIRNDLPLDAVAALRGQVNPVDGFSFFTRHGDLAGRLSFLLTASLALILVLVWLIRKLTPLGRTR